MSPSDARRRIRLEQSSWLAVVRLLRASKVKPKVEWRCASHKACLLLAVYPTPDGELVLYSPSKRVSAWLAEGLHNGNRDLDPLAADLAVFMATCDEDALVAGLPSCRHYECSEYASQLLHEASRLGTTRRRLPDAETPSALIGKSADSSG